MSQVLKDAIYLAVVIFIAIVLVKFLFKIGIFVSLILIGAYLYWRFAGNGKPNNNDF